MSGVSVKKKQFTILITGSRTWDDYETICTKIIEVLTEYVEENPELKSAPIDWLTIMHGDCSQGADKLADIFARDVLKCNIRKFGAQWNVYGKKAGYMRNFTMVSTMPDVCLAFIRDKSKGATGCYNLAKQKGIPSEKIIYDPEKVK